VRWRDPKDIPADGDQIVAERERCHFTLTL
jgi:hypothetical protein